MSASCATIARFLLVKDLDDETLEAIRTAEIPEDSRRLDYLMDDPKTD